MVKCDICYKEFKDNFNLTRHKSRKKPCKPQMLEAAEELHEEEDVSDNEDDRLVCKFCNKIYSSNSVLYRHQRDNCKVIKNGNKEKEKLFNYLVQQVESLQSVREENKRLAKKIREQNKIIKNTQNINNNTINNGTINNTNNTNNTTNNIKIVAFGKEDMSHLTNRDWIRILNKNYKSIEDLALRTHFDKTKPENQNIYISNLRSKYIMVHDGVDWVVKDRNNTVEELYDEKAYIIFTKVEELNESLPITIVDKFDKIKTGYDEEEIRKALIKDLDMTLYNQRKIPICTHKLK